MGVKLLGLLDILAGIAIGLLIFGSRSGWIIAAAVYLIVKSIMFFGGASIVDMLVGGTMLYAFLNPVSNLILIIMALWLIQKGVLSVTLT